MILIVFNRKSSQNFAKKKNASESSNDEPYAPPLSSSGDEEEGSDFYNPVEEIEGLKHLIYEKIEPNTGGI